MKKNKNKVIGTLFFMGVLLIFSCEDYIDIDTPNFQIVSENVFADEETATAAITGITNQLMNTDFANGGENSVTVLGGMSADIIQPRQTMHAKFSPFWQHEISTMESPDALANLSLWSGAYNIIYLTNSALDGLGRSLEVSVGTRKHLRGQALFLRAFAYFYLTNLYGDVPLILNTEFRNNAIAPRNQSAEVWNQIIIDLDEAVELLEGSVSYPNGERTHVNQYVVKALLARVHLYQENWAKAEELSSDVIAQTNTYEILTDFDQVFLANSREAIWQITPAGSLDQRTTFEAGVFIRYALIPGVLVVGNVILSENFIREVQIEDLRLTYWVGKELNNNGETINYYAHKYKLRVAPNQDIPEFSMALRLTEQYLIRAEARVMQGNRSGAVADLDKIRERAGLHLLADTDPEIGQLALLDSIMEERKKELFAEWGHRWLDLKRTGKASDVLAPFKPLWQNTDSWYPIPEEERIKNPNLSQNLGY